MADEVPKPNGMRKTTKAAITFGSILLSIGPLKEAKQFIMGDQIVTNQRLETTMKESFASLEKKLDKHIDDDSVVHRRLRDLSREDDVALEARCEKHTDKVEARVDTIAELLLNGKKHIN